MYSKILVPLDRSELAECSLDHVRRATSPGSATEVILFRVVEPVFPSEASAWSQAGYTVTEVQAKNIASAKEYLSQIADQLSSEGINARTEVVEGRAAETIIDYAEKNNVDLIILSTHGRSGISRWAFGSVAERVLHHSTVPVLSVAPTACRISQSVKSSNIASNTLNP